MSADEFILDTPVVRDFVAEVRTELARGASPETACAAIRPAFEALLADPGWLPDGSPNRFRVAAWAAASASGSSPGRRRVALALLAGRALGLGDADPRPSRLGAGRPLPGRAGRGDLRAATASCAHLVERRRSRPGDLYELLPPHDDIHRVRTTSAEPSVSHPPAHQRHGLHLAALLRPGHGACEPLPVGVRERGLRRSRAVYRGQLTLASGGCIQERSVRRTVTRLAIGPHRAHAGNACGAVSSRPACGKGER